MGMIRAVGDKASDCPTVCRVVLAPAPQAIAAILVLTLPQFLIFPLQCKWEWKWYKTLKGYSATPTFDTEILNQIVSRRLLDLAPKI